MFLNGLSGSLIIGNNMLSGNIKIYVVDRLGNKRLHYHGDNLVLNIGRQILSNALQSESSNWLITDFKAGNGVHGGTSENPGPPDIDDNDLGGAQIRKSIDAYSFPSSSEVLVEVSLDYSEANGVSITEFGLFTSVTEDKIFSEITFPGIDKTIDIQIFGEWTIRISV